ncbi:MAG: MFS transporter [Myxococcales bacterium]|nr:MFS transporter [Myxococcales bacterium]
MPPPGSIRRDLRLSLGDAVGYGLMAGVAEVYLPAFALARGMRPVLAGLVATAPLLAAGALQLLAPRAIARAQSLRGWVAGCMVAQAVAFVPLIVVALVGGPVIPLVFGAAALYWSAGMAASAGWNPWMTRVVPARIRGHFFGRRQGVLQAAMLVGLLGAGVALQGFADAHRVAHVYAAMFAIAMVARLGSALMIMRQGDGLDRAPQRRTRLRSIPPRLRGTPRAGILGYLIASLAATAISGPFLTPYLLHHEGLGYAGYSVFTAAIVVAKIAALPVLGRLIQRVGVRPVLTACALAIAPIPLLFLVSGQLPWLIATQVFAGVVWAGFELGMLMVLFEAQDDSERTTMQVAFTALQAIGTAAASLLGGALIVALGGGRTAYEWVFVASTIARVAAVTLLIRELPGIFARLPVLVVQRAWTVALRPWGGTIVRPIVDGLERLGVTRRDRR